MEDLNFYNFIAYPIIRDYNLNKYNVFFGDLVDNLLNGNESLSGVSLIDIRDRSEYFNAVLSMSIDNLFKSSELLSVIILLDILPFSYSVNQIPFGITFTAYKVSYDIGRTYYVCHLKKEPTIYHSGAVI